MTGADQLAVRMIGSSGAQVRRVVDILDAIDHQLAAIAATLGHRPAVSEVHETDPVTEVHLRRLAAVATATVVATALPPPLGEFLA